MFFEEQKNESQNLISFIISIRGSAKERDARIRGLTDASIVENSIRKVNKYNKLKDSNEELGIKTLSTIKEQDRERYDRYRELRDRYSEMGYNNMQADMKARLEVNKEIGDEMLEAEEYRKDEEEYGKTIAKGREIGRRINLTYKPVKIKDLKGSVNKIDLV